MKPLTLKEIQEECNRVRFEYNNTIYCVNAKQATAAKKIVIFGDAPDTRDPSKIFKVMWHYDKEEFYSLEELRQKIMAAIEAMIIHEVRECLKFDGKALFNEHGTY